MPQYTMAEDGNNAWAQDPSTGAILDCTAVSYGRAPEDFEREDED